MFYHSVAFRDGDLYVTVLGMLFYTGNMFPDNYRMVPCWSLTIGPAPSIE